VRIISFHISTVILSGRPLSGSTGDRDITAYDLDTFSTMGRLTREEEKPKKWGPTSE
jgi:hypothetical protein